MNTEKQGMYAMYLIYTYITKLQNFICRIALKTFLETSNMYRPAVVLGKIKDTNLQMECALVYGKVRNIYIRSTDSKIRCFQMDEHEKALNILVGKLGDTKEAERYCTVNSRVS